MTFHLTLGLELLLKTPVGKGAFLGRAFSSPKVWFLGRINSRNIQFDLLVLLSDMELSFFGKLERTQNCVKTQLKDLFLKSSPFPCCSTNCITLIGSLEVKAIQT